MIARNELRNLLLVLDGSAVLLDAQSSPHRRKLLYNELDEHLSRPVNRASGTHLLSSPVVTRALAVTVRLMASPAASPPARP